MGVCACVQVLNQQPLAGEGSVPGRSLSSEQHSVPSRCPQPRQPLVLSPEPEAPCLQNGPQNVRKESRRPGLQDSAPWCPDASLPGSLPQSRAAPRVDGALRTRRGVAEGASAERNWRLRGRCGPLPWPPGPPRVDGALRTRRCVAEGSGASLRGPSVAEEGSAYLSRRLRGGRGPLPRPRAPLRVDGALRTHRGIWTAVGPSGGARRPPVRQRPPQAARPGEGQQQVTTGPGL